MDRDTLVFLIFVGIMLLIMVSGICYVNHSDNQRNIEMAKLGYEQTIIDKNVVWIKSKTDKAEK